MSYADDVNSINSAREVPGVKSHSALKSTLPCESHCGSPTYCDNPKPGAPNWQAFWERHPSRAKHSRPLSYYHATRYGAKP